MFYFVEVVITKILAAVPVTKHTGDWNIIFTWVDNSGRRTKLLRMTLLWSSQPNCLWSCHEKFRQCTVFMNAIGKKTISFPELVKVKKKRSFEAFMICHKKWRILLDLPSSQDIYQRLDIFILQFQSYYTFQTHQVEGEDHSLDCRNRWTAKDLQ